MRGGEVFTVNGYRGTLKEMSDHFGVNIGTLRTRLRLGWSLRDAVQTPVNKLKSTKTGRVLEIGSVKAFPGVMEKRFGVCLDNNSRADVNLAISHIRKYKKPVFFNIGEDYTGTLFAISEDFGCPISELKKGINAGLTPEDVLKNMNCTERVGAGNE